MVGQTVLGKFRVLRPLDQGGLSKLYVARQLDNGQEVVVKVLKDEYLGQSRAVGHFRHEIQIMAHFQHPNAVGYLDADADDPQGPVLVMEYLRGADLGQLLQREGRFAPDRTGRLLVQLCDVLGAAHAQGIVHRDLKPGNIFVVHPGTPQETVKLMDFGLAKMRTLLYYAPEDLNMVEQPLAAGTPEYMSPEQAMGHHLDGRSDLYSLGVVLFEMLTGRRPFERPGPNASGSGTKKTDSVEALLLAHTSQPPPRFADVGAGGQVPDSIEEVVLACLAKDPDDRPQTAAELLEHYERALGRKLTLARSTRRLTPVAATAGPAGGGEATPRPWELRRSLGGLSPGATPAPRSGSEPQLRTAGRYQVTHSVEAFMPDSMALFKLKGFIQDLGGDVLETAPGLIRVRLPEPPAGAAPAKSQWGALFSWLGGKKESVAVVYTDVELRMERRDPTQPSKMTITLVMLPPRGQPTPEWQSRCKRITQELQAYLMSR